MAQAIENTNDGRRGNRIWIIVLIVLLLLAAAGLGGGYLLQQNELAQLQAGRAAVAAGQWETAVAELNGVADPALPFLAQNTIEATGLRGVAYYHQGQFELAQTDLTAALAQDPNLVDLYAYRALIQFESGETEGALADSAEALQHSASIPEHLQVRLQAQRATALLAEGDKSGAAEAALEAVASAEHLSDESLVMVYTVLVQTAASDEDSAAYGRELEQLGASLDETAQAQLLLAQIGVAAEEADDAAVLDLSTEALDLLDVLTDEQIAEVYLRRAEIFFARDELEMALEAAQEAAAYDDSLALPHALEAWQLYRQFSYDEALAKAGEALALGESSLAYRVRGGVHYIQDHFAEAAADLEQAVALDEQDAEAWLLLARVYGNQSQYEAFMEAAKTAVSLDPGSVAGLWAQGLLYDFDYQYDLAREAYSAALALDDGRPELYLDRATTYYLVSDDPERLEDIERALALNPQSVPAMAMEASYYRDRYDYARFDEKVELLQETAPESLDLYILQAIQANHARNTAEALAFVDQAQALNETSLSLQRLRIDIESQAEEDWATAEEEFRIILEKIPSSISTRYSLAQVLSLQDKIDEAYVMLDEVREIAPHLPWTYVQYALVALNENDMDKAWTFVQQALLLDPQLAEAYAYRGIVHSSSGDFVEATSDYTRALDIYPDYGEAHYFLGGNYLDLGDFEAARRELNTAIRLMPDNPMPHYLLSLMALFEEDFAEVEEQIGLFAEKSNRGVEQFVNHAGILLELGLYEDALAIAQDGLAEFDDNGDLYYYQGLGHLFLGDKEAAQESLRQALTYPAAIDRVVQIEDDLIASESAAEISGDMFVITNEELGFTIGYPIDWIPQEAVDSYAFIATIESNDKYGGANLIVIQDLQGVSSRALADLVGQQLNSNPSFKQISLTTTTFGGRDNVWVREYELDAGGGLIFVGRQYYLAVSPGTAYILTVETDLESEEATTEDLQRIVDSFALIP